MRNTIELESVSGRFVVGDMKDFSKTDLTGHASQLSEEYSRHCNLPERKTKGQFFTSQQVSRFMASLLDINKTDITILDPGAGLGTLSAAVCERILCSEKTHFVTLHAYETDQKILPYLQKVLIECKQQLEEKGHSFQFEIFDKDFVLNNSHYLRKESLFGEIKDAIFYDRIISNPPYYKLNKDSDHAKIMSSFLSGQPNIYAFFMALSLEMLREDGQMVFITPRSFCSGLYFKRFREWLIREGTIRNIHLFESRKNVFEKEEVLQENIIIKITPRGDNQKQPKVLITKSRDRLFSDFQRFPTAYDDILHRKNGDTFIKIPTSEIEVKIQHAISSWKNTLSDFGFKVSTGPVVSFRSEEFLSPEFKNKSTTVPLLWMHNVRGMEVVWPLAKKNKADAIKIIAKQLLLPTSNYVLIKRFTSKEQKRRLYAGVLEKSRFDFEGIGIENHLNYVYKYKGMLHLDETYGIAAILNTSFIDIFFRMLNGNTQVNALDVGNLPFPSLEEIRKIGSLIRDKKQEIDFELDTLVIQALKLDKQILNDLKDIYTKNGKN